MGCSVYEFSRIFSFLTGMSLSEHIRRRRLSQAVFDLQNSNEKIVDIALKYGYESPTTFTRAFRELHGVTPSSVRKTSVPLKTYPPITFLLTVKGVTGMEFRIEKKECFQIWACLATTLQNAGQVIPLHRCGGNSWTAMMPAFGMDVIQAAITPPLSGR